ncbi:MAG TPA: NADH-quinone oxidoreductase subunit J [Polyangiaceae bacterium]
METFVFGVVALIGVLSALAVAAWNNLIHCVLWLAIVLLDTALVFVALHASFLGGIQVMLYAGGVVTLMLFAIMLTRRGGGVIVSNDTDPKRRLPALLISGGLFGVMAWAILSSESLDKATPRDNLDVQSLARAFLGHDVLAFEVLSILLLSATVGAIVIARRRDFGAPLPMRPGRERQS